MMIMMMMVCNAGGGASSSAKVYVGYSVYKGKAALTVEPRAPEFALMDVCCMCNACALHCLKCLTMELFCCILSFSFCICSVRVL